MNRRSFSKALAGSAMAARIRGSAMEADPARATRRDVTPVVPAKLSATSDAPPSGGSTSWELVILDAAPPHAAGIGGLAAADIDGDGKTELVAAGNGALLWYRPSTSEKGIIASGSSSTHAKFTVGVALEDTDGDGRKEVFVGKQTGEKGGYETWCILRFKPGTNLLDPWEEHVVDSETAGHPHDIVFGDVDGDGRRELVANAIYCAEPGLFVYKAPGNSAGLWKKQAVQNGYSAEGTVTGDLDGDGKEEIVSGPYWYAAPRAGAFSGQPWKAYSLAPDFRELCRAALIDVNGDGRLDAVLVEDEYPDGRLAWFENRLASDRESPWIGHPIDAPFNFSHSLRAWSDAKSNQVHVLAAEMNAGGWNAPYNWDARLLKYTAFDKGTSWSRELIYQGEGTHEAVYTDLDGSGSHVIFGAADQIPNKEGIWIENGKVQGTNALVTWIQMFRPQEKQSVFAEYEHSFIDRSKPYTGIDMHAVDVDGDGRLDIVCGAWWYKNPGWERHAIPGIGQIINAYDLDKDGRKELIGVKGTPGGKEILATLSTELVWLKPIDLSKDLWEEYSIGKGDGDWPHGSAIGPLLPGGGVALVVGYHEHFRNPPQLFKAPSDPKHPWEKRLVADIPYGEEMLAYDLDGDGKLDIVAGPYWLENMGDGTFKPHLLIDPELLKSASLDQICRIAIADVNNDGRPDILFSLEAVDYSVHQAYFVAVGWLENTGSLRDRKFNVHVIDKIRSPHSLSVGDLDGDGELEVVVGEHDPFHPYRSKSRLYVYKKADRKGLTWSRYPIDNRFEHHDGAKVVELVPGRLDIISHAWREAGYVHLWRPKSLKDG